jgi:hypothetical protein
MEISPASLSTVYTEKGLRRIADPVSAATAMKCPGREYEAKWALFIVSTKCFGAASGVTEITCAASFLITAKYILMRPSRNKSQV